MTTPDQLRKLLAENARLSARAGAHGANIRKAAAEELERVQGRLSALTTGPVLTDEVKASEYRRLIEDRGRLHKLVASGDA